MRWRAFAGVRLGGRTEGHGGSVVRQLHAAKAGPRLVMAKGITSGETYSVSGDWCLTETRDRHRNRRRK